MAWTDPAAHVFASGEVLTAANLNTYVKDNLLFLYNPPCARVYATALTSCPASTATPIAFDAESFDTDAIHDNVTNNTRLTCKTAGKYLIKGELTYIATTSGQREIQIRLNGTTTLSKAGVPSSSADTIQCATVHALAVNDYVELCFTQFCGAGLAMSVVPSAPAGWVPHFSMVRLSA